jgi:hypothetical protein
MVSVVPLHQYSTVHVDKLHKLDFEDLVYTRRLHTENNLFEPTLDWLFPKGMAEEQN